VALKKFFSNITEALVKKHGFDGGETLVDRNMNLELAFIDKEGKYYSLSEVNSAELAKGLEKISREIAARLQLQKEQR
jgi:hypothetical protein